MRLDFFARYTNHIDHLAPLWNRFPAERRGVFYTTEKTADYAVKELKEATVFDGDLPMSDNPILVSSHGDILRAHKGGRERIIHIEHGIGHGFGTAAYPDGRGGARDYVSLFLAPNEYTARRMRKVRDTRVEVVGTPKMDDFAGYFPATEKSSNPVIAIGFHWGDRGAQPPESGSAFEAYEEILPALNERYNLIGYAHPLAFVIIHKGLPNGLREPPYAGRSLLTFFDLAGKFRPAFNESAPRGVRLVSPFISAVCKASRDE